MPRIKTKPKPDSFGNFSQFVLYKNFNWQKNSIKEKAQDYIDQRRLKIFKFEAEDEPQINR
jgi:hypothetical protein